MGNRGGARIFNSSWLDTDKNHPLWCLGPRTLQVYLIKILLIFDSYRTSEAGNGETGPSTLSSLVGNFPCMPQSPTFTHSPEGLGPSFPKAFNPAHTPHSLSTGPELLSSSGGVEYTTRGHFCPHCRALNFNEPYMPPLEPHFSHKSKIEDLRFSLFAFFYLIN